LLGSDLHGKYLLSGRARQILVNFKSMSGAAIYLLTLWNNPAGRHGTKNASMTIIVEYAKTAAAAKRWRAAINFARASVLCADDAVADTAGARDVFRASSSQLMLKNRFGALS
jgi:hypothetical protein